MPRPHLVERGNVVDVREIDLCLHDACERGARAFERRHEFPADNVVSLELDAVSLPEVAFGNLRLGRNPAEVAGLPRCEEASDEYVVARGHDGRKRRRGWDVKSRGIERLHIEPRARPNCNHLHRHAGAGDE